MPIEVECHTIPHLKALTSGIEHRSGHSEPEFLGGKNQFGNTHFTT